MLKILIPTDFSENAMNAIKYALKLFRKDDCAFYFMHAFQDEIYGDKVLLTQETLDDVTRIVNERSTHQLEEMVKQVKNSNANANHHYRIICENGQLLDETDKIVEDNNIDLIVMGTRGKTNDRKLTFGSHTLQVLKYVQCPVLAVPENYTFSEPKRILFPTNYLIPYKSRELEMVGNIAKTQDAVIDMFYVSKIAKLSLREEKNRKHIKEKLDHKKISFLTVINAKIIEAIYTYIEEDEVDLLVMVNTKHSFLENILYQSTIDAMSLHLSIPFLALQNMNRSS